MTYFISPSAARKRFDDLCLDLNCKQEPISFTRETSSGPRTITRQRKAVSDGAQATGKAIIQLYASRLKTLSATMPEGLLAEGPPSLPTNNVKLSGYRQNVSDRTIRGHIRILKDIGLISSYKFHGTKNNFEIWLNPAIVFGPDYAVSQTPVPVFSDPDCSVRFPGRQDPAPADNRKNFPLKHTIETNGNSNTSTSKAEKSPTYGEQDMATTPSGLRIGQNDSLNADHGNNGKGGAAAANVDNYVENRWITPEASPTFNALHPYFYRAVRTFWTYAIRSLWPDREFSELEYSRAAESITTGFYLPLIRRRPNKKQFDEFQEELLKAVDVARRYYENHPEHHPGDPYSGNYGATGYFDAENPRGFQVAINWRFKNKASNAESYGHRVIKTALRHLQNHGSGKIPKHLQGKSYIQLYEFYSTKMQRFEPELRAIFYRRVAALKGLDQDAVLLAHIGLTNQKINIASK